jgi:hypothetical protein
MKQPFRPLVQPVARAIRNTARPVVNRIKNLEGINSPYFLDKLEGVNTVSQNPQELVELSKKQIARYNAWGNLHTSASALGLGGLLLSILGITPVGVKVAVPSVLISLISLIPKISLSTAAEQNASRAEELAKGARIKKIFR